MAINKEFKLLEESILSTLGIKYSGLRWCELGDQIYYGPPPCAAKKIYTKCGVLHTSIDINGLNGSIALDLDQPIPSNFIDSFDVVTNYGTTEHINNQYEVFKSIHNMCKCSGVILHGVPLIFNWAKHCRYYYTKDFFAQLAKLCNYSVVDLRILNSNSYLVPKNLVVSVYRKVDNSPFISKELFDSIPGIYDSKFINASGCKRG